LQIDDGNEGYLKWIGETIGAKDDASSEKKAKLDDS